MLEWIYQVDFTVLNWIQDHLRNSVLDAVTGVFGTIGHAGLVWIILSVVLLFFKRTRLAGIMALLSMGLGYLLGDLVIKPLLQRPRPFLTESDLNQFRDAALFTKTPSGFSFPSGHSCAAAAFTTVLLAKNKALGFIVLPFALFMMFSRLYCYVHFPSDVLCGALLGVLSALLILLIFRETKLDRKLSSRKRRA